MKIKTNFVLHVIGDEHVAVPVGERTEELHGMIRLNATGAFLWKQMEKDCTEQMLSRALMQEYEISEKTAQDAVAAFLEQLAAANVIEK